MHTWRIDNSGSVTLTAGGAASEVDVPDLESGEKAKFVALSWVSLTPAVEEYLWVAAGETGQDPVATGILLGPRTEQPLKLAVLGHTKIITERFAAAGSTLFITPLAE